MVVVYSNGVCFIKQKTAYEMRISDWSSDVCSADLHNADGWREVLANIEVTPHRILHMVIGIMRDKEPAHSLPMLPNDARYYFCQVAMPRALPAEELRTIGADHGLDGDAFDTVAEALAAAKLSASAAD